MIIVDETRQELAERMAQEVVCSVSRALEAVDRLIAKGLIELVYPWQPLHTAPHDPTQDILIKHTFSDGYSYQDIARWTDAGDDGRGYFKGGRTNFRPQDWTGKNRDDFSWRPVRGVTEPQA